MLVSHKGSVVMPARLIKSVRKQIYKIGDGTPYADNCALSRESMMRHGVIWVHLLARARVSGTIDINNCVWMKKADGGHADLSKSMGPVYGTHHINALDKTTIKCD